MSTQSIDTIKLLGWIAGVAVSMIAGTWIVASMIQTQPLQISNIERQLAKQDVALESLNSRINQLNVTVGILLDRINNQNSRNDRRRTPFSSDQNGR